LYHFKAKGTIDHEKDEICNFTNVNHAIEIVGTFNKSESPFLPANDCDGTLGFAQSLFCVSADETFEESGFPDTGGANDGDDDRGRVFMRGTADKGNMEASLALFCSPTALSVCSPARIRGKCLGDGSDRDQKKT